jgi:hypothetical protein
VSIKRDLRAQPTRLLGREGDLEVIREVLRREEVRLLSLTGPAGVGKTRLAIEAGTQVSDDFAQGVVFVDLSPISDPTHVPQALARGADLQDVESPRLPERLFAYLRERNSLVHPGQLRAASIRRGVARGSPGGVPLRHAAGHEPGGAPPALGANLQGPAP